VNIKGFGPLLRRVQLALYPAHCFLGFQRIGTVTIKALERARTVAARRQRKDQNGPATGASRTFNLAHPIIFAPVPILVNSKKWAIPAIKRAPIVFR
jgi:hypothetical protein